VTKFIKNWRQNSLENLENHNWGDTANAPTNLVQRCIELSKIPVCDFSLSDLRLMIGQKFGLQFLVPLAIEKIQDDIFIEIDYYEGDLLSSILEIDTSFWNYNENHWTQLNKLITNKRHELEENKIVITKFDNSKFGATKGCH
jgi:hypothetical protein